MMPKQKFQPPSVLMASLMTAICFAPFASALASPQPVVQVAQVEGEESPQPDSPEAPPAPDAGWQSAPPPAPEPAAAPPAQVPPAPERPIVRGGPAPGHPHPAHKRMMLRMMEDGDERTDHQKVVGLWGVEARRLGIVRRSPNNPDPRCANAAQGCPLELNAVGVRRWVSEHYAFNAALALSVGGGSTEGMGSWDTHFGVGPVLGANFLLAAWKHLAVSANPQLTFVAFLPSGSGQKTYLLDLRGLIEAEIQLGFIGLPHLAVGTNTGIGFTYEKLTDGGPMQTGFSAWDISMVGPNSLWDIVTDMFVRYYF